MIYLKIFEDYDSFSQVEEDIEDIKLILQDMIDDYYIVDIDFVPKRWENPPAYTVDTDFIKIYIKKNHCRRSMYPIDSEFSPSIISNELNMILSIHKGSKIEFKVCIKDNEYSKIAKPPVNNIHGIWKDVPNINSILNKDKIIGLELKIFLGSKNIDKL